MSRTAANNDELTAADDSAPTRTPYPVHLTEPPTEYKTRTDDPRIPASSDRRASTAGSRTGSDAAQSSAPNARLIRTFANAYLDMNKAQRVGARIMLPGITDADRYQYAFRRIPQWNIDRLTSPRVFYAQLRWTANLDDIGNEYRVTLNAGHFDNAARIFDRPWVLAVPYSDWTIKAHNLFRAEFDDCVNHARLEGLQPWVFALAKQSDDDTAVLQVRIRQHMAFMPLSGDRAPGTKLR